MIVARTSAEWTTCALCALSQATPLSRLTRNNETKGAVMKVFVAGATGVLGRVLVPQLVARGHEVVGMTRKRIEAGPGAQPGSAPGGGRRARPRRGRAGGGVRRARGDRA